METLTRRNYGDGMRVLRDLSAAGLTTGEFARRGLVELPTLVGSELTTLSVCDLAAAKRVVQSNPDDAISATDRACFDLFFRQHPLVRYHSRHPDGGSYKLSDAYAPRQFRRTALYNEYYRRIGIEHAIAVPLFVDNRLLVSFVLNRSGRDFSERDRALLDLLRGPLANIYRQAVALERAKAAAQTLREWIATGRASMVTGPRRRLRACSPAAAALLDYYCSGAKPHAGTLLPTAIDDWLKREIARPAAPGIAGIPSLPLEKEGNRLLIHAFFDLDKSGECLLLLEEQSARVTPWQFTALPITPREREVLAWLAAGKTNQEIGAILGTSARTIAKHLEHLYVKLGVETRTAAVMRAIVLAGKCGSQQPFK